MKKSAGISIILNKKKILLVHPTNSRWTGTYGIPKGGIDPGETFIDAAIRETFEEVGIKVPKNKLGPLFVNPYFNNKGTKYKEIYYFEYHISSINEIGLKSEVVPKSQLQIKEVDWAGFLDIKECEKRALSKQMPIINRTLNKSYSEPKRIKTLEEFMNKKS